MHDYLLKELSKNIKIPIFFESPKTNQLRHLKSVLAFASISLLLLGTNTIMIASSQPQGNATQAGQQPQQPSPSPQASPQQVQQLQETKDQLLQQLGSVEQKGEQILETLETQELTPEEQQKKEQVELTPQQQQQLQQENERLAPQQQQQLQAQAQQLEGQKQQLEQRLQEVNLQQAQAQLQAQPRPPPLPPQQQQQKIPVTVRFDSIKINNDHDSGPWNDGEYILDAFINGQNVHLSSVLGDAKVGTTYKLPPNAQATVNVPRNGLVIVNVLGAEEDWCNIANDILTRGKLTGIGLPDLPQKVQTVLNKSGAVQGLTTVTNGLDAFDRLLGTSAAALVGGPLGAAVTAVLGDTVKLNIMNYVNKIGCRLNPNDKTGEINQIYSGPTFGTVPPGTPTVKTVQSTTNDYVLTYVIGLR